jgi:hypothetical protein
MHAHGHTTIGGTPIGVGRARDAKGWYQQLKEWWASPKAMRREARLAALNACWDARREAIKPQRADAAADMIAAEYAFSTATTLYGLTL